MSKFSRRNAKRGRTIRRLSRELFVFFLFLGTLASFYLFLNSDFLRIKKLTCFINQERCSSRMWAGIFDLVSGKSIISLSENFLTQEIKAKYYRIKEVEAKIYFPHSLVVRLTERTPLIKFSLDSLPETFWLVDEEGFFFAKGNGEFEIPRVLVKPEREFEIKKGANLNQFVFGSSLEVFRALTEADFGFDHALIDERKKFMVVVASEWRALFSFDKKMETQVGSLQLILVRAKIEGRLPSLVDLRFNKPVVSF